MFLGSRLVSRKPEVVATILIFALASGVVGATFFYIDSIGSDVFNNLSSNVVVDMEIGFSRGFYNQNNFTLADAIDITRNESLIQDVEIVAMLDSYSDQFYSRTIDLGVDNSFFKTFSNAITLLDGTLDGLDNGSCIVAKSYADKIGVGIGSEYELSIDYWDGNVWNYTTVSYQVVGLFDSQLYKYQDYWEEEEYSRLVMITTIQGLYGRLSGLGVGQDDGLEYRILSKFNREALFGGGVSDIGGALFETQRRIEQKGIPFLLVYQSDLYYATYSYSAWSTGMLSVSLTISIPSILMGFMLVQYNNRLQSDEDRKDIGTVKTRGASGWQAFRWILEYALVIGILGAIGAIFTGYISSYISGGITGLLEYNLQLLLEFQVITRPSAFLLIFSYSFIIGLIVALPQAVDAYTMTPTEAHSSLEKDILLDKEQFGGYFKELIGVAVSFFIFQNLMMVFLYSSFLSYLVLTIFILVVPVLAVLIISITRLTSRPTSSIKSKILSRINRPSLKVGTRLLGRITQLNKKSEAIGVIFISLVFTAGTLSSIAATSGSMHIQDLLYFDKGADIIVQANPSMTNVSTALLNNITRIEGVRDASAMLVVEGQVAYRTQGRLQMNYIDIIGVQPEKWAETAFWLPYFTLHGSSDTAMSELTSSNTSILSSFKPISYYQPGFFVPVYSDSMRLGVDSGNGTIWSNCTIVDVISNTDMMGGTTFIAGQDLSSAVVVNIAYLHGILNSTQVSSFYVDIEDGANVTKLIDDIKTIAPSSFEAVESPIPLIEEVMASRMNQAIMGTYSINLLYSLVYLTIGFSIVSAIKGRNMRKQFSILRALGSESKSIMIPSLIDSILTIIISAIIGVLLGWFLAAFMSIVPLFYISDVTQLSWSVLPVRILIPYILFIGIIGFTILFGLGSNYLVTRRILSRNIAEEIQYLE